MNVYFSVCFIVALALIFLSRVLAERALKQLGSEKKLGLIDAFSGMRMYSMAPLLVIIAVFLLAVYLWPGNHAALFTLYLAAILIYTVAIHVVIARRLQKLDLPGEYVRKYLISRHVGHAGLLILFGGLAYVR